MPTQDQSDYTFIQQLRKILNEYKPVNQTDTVLKIIDLWESRQLGMLNQQ